MYNLFSKLPIRIILAVIVGLALASIFTKLNYGCIPEGVGDCGGTKFAVLHLDDLLNNPGERGNFVETFLAGSIISFLILSIVVRFGRKA